MPRWKILISGARMTHVPYKGSPQAVADLVAGNVQVGIPTMPAALPFIKAGRARALAITSGKRTPVLPDVPTMQEAGVQGYETDLWTGILAPQGTPPAVLSKLHGEIVQVGTPSDIYEYPNSRFVADFIGSVNMFEGRMIEDEPDHVRIESEELGGTFYIDHGVSAAPTATVWVAIRPEKIALSREKPTGTDNQARGVVKEIAYMGTSRSISSGCRPVAWCA